LQEGGETELTGLQDEVAMVQAVEQSLLRPIEAQGNNATFFSGARV
jgi:hypothetical protein